MAYIYKNITGNTATDLEVQEIDNNTSNSSSSSYSSSSNNSSKYTLLSTMSLCNVHATDSVNIDLYLYRTEMTDSRSKVGEGGDWNDLEFTTYSYYILNNVNIPNGATLVLDKEDLKFDRSIYQLYIKLSDADSEVDIILK